jgi:hypothetical protein
MSDKRAVMTPAERRVYLAAMRAHRARVRWLKSKGLKRTFWGYADAQDALYKVCAAAERKKGE